MLSWLPKPVVGVVAITLYILSLLICSVIIYIFAIFKLFLRGKSGYVFYEKVGHNSAKLLAYLNDGIIALTSKTIWDIDDVSGLSQRQWYFLLSNHQSWADILILEKVFARKISMTKFFWKKELIWVPLVGSTCWILNFPVMKRFSREFLEKNPHLRGTDLATTRKACAAYKEYPATLINFVEGTRFTPEKHAHQHSPYKHLLRPKAGGVAFTLACMDGTMKELINATLIYDEKANAWDYFCGRIKKITVRFTVTPIPAELIGDYENDPAFKTRFQHWLNQLWHEKDALIDIELDAELKKNSITQEEIQHASIDKNCHSKKSSSDLAS